MRRADAHGLFTPMVWSIKSLSDMPLFYNEKGDDDIKRPVLREYLR